MGGGVVRAVCGSGRMNRPPIPPTTRSTPPGHELRGKQSTWQSTCRTGEPVTPSLGLSLNLVKATRLYKAFTEQS